MTRHTQTLASAEKAGKHVLLEPLAPARNLTSDVVERIANEIHSGKLAPGARLPTEQEMMRALGVSRTVIREAFAALKADGLVTTRQGSGAYVASDADRRPFRLRTERRPEMSDVQHVLELRLAVEIEAAALAARRAAPAALRRITLAHARFEKAIERGEMAVPEDFAFHRAIAEATGNPQFLRFLEFLGGFIIPRQRVRLDGLEREEHSTYLRRLVVEHARIRDMIVSRDPNRAAAAMRDHLTRSIERYGHLRRE
ncbi:MAG: FadR/GntR family transcriptional regulator [Hyphomicrobiaceae bacterium]